MTHSARLFFTGGPGSSCHFCSGGADLHTRPRARPRGGSRRGAERVLPAMSPALGRHDARRDAAVDRRGAQPGRPDRAAGCASGRTRLPMDDQRTRPPLRTLSVRAYRAADRAAWSAFVAACPESTFFHRIEWRDLLEGVFRHRTHYLMAERDGSVVGVLPLAEMRSLLFGHALVSLPFAEHAGVAAIDADAVAALHAAACELSESLRVQHLELRNFRRREPDWPEQDLYVTFRKRLEPDPEDNLRAVPKSQRAMVRRAARRGLASEIDSDTSRFFDLYADNVQRHGTPALPRRYFDELLRAFGRDCEVMTILDAAGRPVSSVLSFFFRDQVLPYYGGDITAARALAANDFRCWELMRRAVERGARLFDYGRSKRGTGSYDFKRFWGFTPEPLHYEYALLRRAAVPQHNPSNPRYRAPMEVWKRLPRPLVNWLGPHIVRNLG
jgi:FemAB-related protein (PEP-CTERM system-associated)